MNIFSLSTASCWISLILTTGASHAQGTDPRLQWDAKETSSTPGHEPKACLHNSVQAPRYEALNGSDNGDKLSVPRRIAAAVVGQLGSDPKLVDDVGAYQSEFLEAFLDRFPHAHGIWTASTNSNYCVDKIRLARFADRVTYNMNCPAHDFTDGCVAKNADVILASWLSSHHTIAGISGFYGNAGAQLPVGGWVISLDHVRIPDEAMATRMKAARKEFHADQEGGPQTVQPVATLQDHMIALRAAGFDDAQLVWQSFDVVLLMAQKSQSGQSKIAAPTPGTVAE